MRCKFFGHKWKYNFPSIPDKRICSSCKKKEKLNLRMLSWTDTFEDGRSDAELIEKWFNEPKNY